MPYCLDNLEAFAKQFAGNWSTYSGFFWDRDDITDPENWGIIYTKNPQSTPLEIVNSEHLKYLFWVYLRNKHKKTPRKRDVVPIRNRHIAGGTEEGFLIRIYHADTITNACATLYDHLSALRDYPVADPEALDKFEAEIFADQWPDILKMIVAEFDGEQHPFFDDGYRYFINLKKLGDTERIGNLFHKYNPRAYWSSDTECFRLQHFLYDITDGRVSFDDICAAHPENVMPNYSAVLANPA